MSGARGVAHAQPRRDGRRAERRRRQPRDRRERRAFFTGTVGQIHMRIQFGLSVARLFMLGALVASSGCVSASEYRAFVAASRGFYDSVVSVFSEATLRDDGLADLSKR